MNRASNDDWYDGPRDRSLRVGDAERDAISEVLRKRHLEGRLDADEFQVRLERCMEAKTYADLDELIADLPDAREHGHTDERTTLRPRPLPFLPFPFVPLLVIAAIVVAGHFAWLAVPLLVFFVVRPLIWRGWGRRGWGRRACM